ncbi:unnamed protein product [Leptidea sinapis]|uniref:Uncharacterized protein n=1 Tax=Leptidea sinapis TaxID=189913 RepID=A0A5E4R2W5_9NEOP|nr:unnamed protein product [Leptidea sinapis]
MGNPNATNFGLQLGNATRSSTTQQNRSLNYFNCSTHNLPLRDKYQNEDKGRYAELRATHPNPLATKLLESSQATRRLKRKHLIRIKAGRGDGLQNSNH